MITHNIDPVLINIGPLEIRYYGLVYVIGILLTYWFLQYVVEKKEVPGLSKDTIDELILYIMLGVLFGGRLLSVGLYQTHRLITDPLVLFKVWEGGMAFHGALLGVVGGLFYFSKKYHVNFYQLADLVVLPTSIGLFLGRIANFINGELIGRYSDLPFCIQYEHAEGCRHPSQIYEALKNIFLFFVLFKTYLQKKYAPGFLFWLFIGGYGLLRFLVTFFRADTTYYGLSSGQYASLIMFVTALPFIYKLYKKSDDKN